VFPQVGVVAMPGRGFTKAHPHGKSIKGSGRIYEALKNKLGKRRAAAINNAQVGSGRKGRGKSGKKR
jgi:hypothetical protein